MSVVAVSPTNPMVGLRGLLIHAFALIFPQYIFFFVSQLKRLRRREGRWRGMRSLPLVWEIEKWKGK